METISKHRPFAVVGDNLRSLREAIGKRNCDITRELGLGEGTWSKWESGERLPGGSNVQKLARYFCVTEADILSIDLRPKADVPAQQPSLIPEPVDTPAMDEAGALPDQDVTLTERLVDLLRDIQPLPHVTLAFRRACDLYTRERFASLNPHSPHTRVCVLGDHSITLYLSADYQTLNRVELRDNYGRHITVTPSFARHIAEYGGEYESDGDNGRLQLPVRLCNKLQEMLADYPRLLAESA